MQYLHRSRGTRILHLQDIISTRVSGIDSNWRARRTLMASERRVTSRVAASSECV